MRKRTRQSHSERGAANAISSRTKVEDNISGERRDKEYAAVRNRASRGDCMDVRRFGVWLRFRTTSRNLQPQRNGTRNWLVKQNQQAFWAVLYFVHYLQRARVYEIRFGRGHSERLCRRKVTTKELT